MNHHEIEDDDNNVNSFFEKLECELRFVDTDDSDDNKDYNGGDDEEAQKINEYVFVDVQGFKGSHNRFICKEFCLVYGSEIFHEIVQSPFPVNRFSLHLRKQVEWTTQNFHGLNYADGDVHIIELTKKIFPKLQNKKILVKGGEKVKWLEYMFRFCGKIDCINIEDLHIEDIYRENDSYDWCDSHRWIKEGTLAVCAKYNAMLLQDLAKRNVNAL